MRYDLVGFTGGVRILGHDDRSAARRMIDMPRIQDIEFSINLGEAIRARRDWLELSQNELGKLVGITGAQVTKYETGQASPSVLGLVRLATALETTVNGLLGFCGTPAASNGHLTDLAAILADGDIAAVVKAMQAMIESDRKRTAVLVDAYFKGMIGVGVAG